MHFLSKNKRPGVDDSEKNRRIFDFLSKHGVGVLTSVDPNNNPHATTVYFSTDKHFGIFFITKKGTKKYDNLTRNGHAMLVCYDQASQTTAQISGSVAEINDEEMFNNVYGRMVKISEATSEAGLPPISKLSLGEYVLMGITPSQIRMAVFARPDPGGYDMYETIDFS